MPGLDGALLLFRELGVGGVERVAPERLLQGQLLFRIPPSGVLPVDGRPGDGRVDARERVERGDHPVRAQGELRSALEEGLEGVGRAGPSFPIRFSAQRPSSMA